MWWEIIRNTSMLFLWKDCCEILFFSWVVYRFSCWLSKEQDALLLCKFYGYCLAFFIAYYFQLTGVILLLGAFAPALILFFVSIHQDMLQKHFVTAKKKCSDVENQNDSWIDVCIRVCLQAMNKDKALAIIIEKEDSLQNLLVQSLPLKTKITQEVLTALINSTTFDETSFIWVTKSGEILAINALFNGLYMVSSSKNAGSKIQYNDAALLFTHKTDAIIVYANTLLRSFTVINGGQLLEQLQPSVVVRILKNDLYHKKKIKYEGMYGTITHTTNKQINA